MVRGKPVFAEIADDVRIGSETGPLVAHNASFDEAFLRHAYARLGQKLTNPKLCTLRLARRLLPRLPTYRLDALTTYFGIKNRGRHRALGDAEATARARPPARSWRPSAASRRWTVCWRSRAARWAGSRAASTRA